MVIDILYEDACYGYSRTLLSEGMIPCDMCVRMLDQTHSIPRMSQEVQEELQIALCILLFQQALPFSQHMQQLVDIIQLEVCPVLSDQLDNQLWRSQLPACVCSTHFGNDLNVDKLVCL